MYICHLIQAFAYLLLSQFTTSLASSLLPFPCLLLTPAFTSPSFASPSFNHFSPSFVDFSLTPSFSFLSVSLSLLVPFSALSSLLFHSSFLHFPLSLSLPHDQFLTLPILASIPHFFIFSHPSTLTPPFLLPSHIHHLQ